MCLHILCCIHTSAQVSFKQSDEWRRQDAWWSTLGRTGRVWGEKWGKMCQEMEPANEVPKTVVQLKWRWSPLWEDKVEEKLNNGGSWRWHLGRITPSSELCCDSEHVKNGLNKEVLGYFCILTQKHILMQADSKQIQRDEEGERQGPRDWASRPINKTHKHPRNEMPLVHFSQGETLQKHTWRTGNHMTCPTYSHWSSLSGSHKLHNAVGHMLCSERKKYVLEMIAV